MRLGRHEEKKHSASEIVRGVRSSKCLKGEKIGTRRNNLSKFKGRENISKTLFVRDAEIWQSRLEKSQVFREFDREKGFLRGEEEKGEGKGLEGTSGINGH